MPLATWKRTIFNPVQNDEVVDDRQTVPRWLNGVGKRPFSEVSASPQDDKLSASSRAKPATWLDGVDMLTQFDDIR